MVCVCAAQVFPWYGDKVLEFIRVSFVGPKDKAEWCLKLLCCEDDLLRADFRVVLWWLRFLKAVNHEYEHLQIPDDEVLENYLKTLPDQIISGAQITDTELCKAVEERIGADLAHVRTVPQNDPDDHEQDHEANRQCDSEDDDGAAVNIDDPHARRKLAIILQDSIVVNGLVAEDPDNTQILNSLLQTLQKRHDGEPPPAPDMHVTSKRDGGDPINEYGENDIYHYLAFPAKYPFARGAPPKSSAFKPKYVRHCLLQADCSFAQDMRWYMVQFNQVNGFVLHSRIAGS